jgi:hypothetical protein
MNGQVARDNWAHNWCRIDEADVEPSGAIQRNKKA